MHFSLYQGLMKLRATIFLILINSALFAQNRVKLFEDYRTCSTGIKTHSGTIIHEAIFSNVRELKIQLTDSRIFFYKVQFDEFVGLLDQFGTVILPWKYDYIHVLPDSSFIVSLGGRYGIVDRNDSILLDFKYDFLESQEAYDYRIKYGHYGTWQTFSSTVPSHYVFTQDSKTGLLDSNFTIKIPARFESITKTIYNYLKSRSGNDCYYLVSDNSFFGALDSNGRELLPCKYTSIQAIVTNHDNEVVPYFLLADDQHRFGFQRFNGDVIFPHKLKRINFTLGQSKDDGHYSIQSVIAKSEDTVAVYNFASKRYYRNLLNAMPFDRFVLFEDKNGWGIIDDTGNIITEGNKQTPSIYGGDIQGFPDLKYNEYAYFDGVDDFIRLTPKDDILFISYPHKFKKLYHGSEINLSIKKLGLRGAFNFRTGTKIPMKYWRIIIKKNYNDTYYWAIPPYHANRDSIVKIDIYDYSMSFLRQIQVSLFDERMGESYDDSRNIDFIYDNHNSTTLPNIFICSEKSLLGAYTMQGELILPFEYDQIKPQYATSTSESDETVLYFITTKNNRSGLLNSDMETLLPPEYDHIHFEHGNKLIWAIKNTITTLYNFDLSVCFDEIEEVMYKPHLNFDGSTQLNNQRPVSTYYLKRKGKLYMKEGRTITLMDSTQIHFKTPVITLFDAIKLNTKGQILGALDSRYRPFQHSSGYYFIDNGTLKIADDDWILQLEVPGVSKIQECGGKLILLYTDQSCGVVNLADKKLQFKTDYPTSLVPVESYSGNLSDQYWVLNLNNSRAFQTWNLLNSNGAVIDSLFDFPAVRIIDVTQKNGKYGLLDENLTLLLPYEYDFISSIRDTYYLKKNGLWGTYKKETQKLNSPKYSSISVLELNNGNRIITEPGKVGVIDADLNLVLPLTSTNALSDSSDLFQLVLNGDQTNAHYFGAFETVGLPDAYRQISNENILRNISTHATENTIFELDATKRASCYNEVQPTNRTLNIFGYSEVNRISYKQSNYYSEERKSTRTAVQKTVIVTSHEQTERINYRIKGETFEKIRLQELFADPANMDAILTDLLTTIYTENQAFGLQCPNISAIIEEANNNFLLSRHGIKLFGKTAPTGSVLIPRERLLPFTVDKNMFD